MKIFNQHFDDIVAYVEMHADPLVFNTKNLPKHTKDMQSIRLHPEYRPIFDNLSNKKGSCIYWFELDTEQHCAMATEVLSDYRSFNDRVVPVSGKHPQSKVLYLGVRRGGHYKRDTSYTNIVDRMKVHFGYVKSGKTQGLQLSHWAAGVDMKITLNVYEFPDTPTEKFPDLYLEAIEKIMAQKLKPICGKH